MISLIWPKSTSTNVIILRQAPFTPRDTARYGIERLLDAGAAVAVIDLTRIANPDGKFPATNPDLLPGVAVHVCRVASDMAPLTAAIRGASLIVNDVGSGNVDVPTLPILRWLSRSRRPFLINSTSAVPASDRILNPVSAWARLRRSNLARSFLNRVPPALVGLRAADYAVFGGSRSRFVMRLVDSGTEVIWSQASDQDAADDEIAARPHAPVTGTAVFLDQYFGFHPGAFVRGFGHATDPDFFYPRLRRLFDRIERERGLRVVIAAHPRANYADKPGLFGDRPIEYGNSVRLVRESRLVLASFSTAINFAAIFEKPVLIFTLPSIVGLGYIHDGPHAVAHALGRDPVDISEPDAVNLDAAFTLDPEVYRRFREHYIKSERSSGKRMADVLFDLCARHGAIAHTANGGNLIGCRESGAA